MSETASPPPTLRGKPQILASLGTVLIDCFESPPRPRLDLTNAAFRPPPRASASASSPMAMTTSPTAIVHHARPGSSRPSSPSPLNPSSSAGRSHQRTRSSSRPGTGSSTSTSTASALPLATHTRSDSGVSTPQRSFDSALPSPADEVWGVLGGGGMYALVGGRIWLPSSELRCVVDRAPASVGSDFPQALEDQLNSFGDDIWCWNEGSETRATKARLKYEGNTRYFEYIHPPPRRTIESIKDTPVFGAEYLHIAPPYSPDDLARLVEELRTVRNADGQEWSPKIVFEPHPLKCVPEQREALERIAPSIHVLSPNHEELLSFYGIPSPVLPDPTLPSLVEPIITHLLQEIGVGADGQGIVVIRCGLMGSCVGTKAGGIKWFPAYFGEEDQHRVVDVSGAGNAYLGGYVAGLHLSGGDPYEAALYATVSASFMVEQICLPAFQPGPAGWNNDDPGDRLALLRDGAGR